MTWSLDFESGLLDDFDGTITAATFAPDAQYNNGESTLLILDLVTDSEETPETRILIPLGKGWISTDRGKTVEHESGKEGKYFNRQAAYAMLITRCVTDLGIGGVLEGRGTPFQSQPWVGLSFHWKQEEVNYGGEIGAKKRMLPVKFLGEGAGAKVGVKPVQTTLGSTTADAPIANVTNGAVAPAAAANIAGQVSAQEKILRVKLIAAAKEAIAGGLGGTDFLDIALGMDGVADSAMLVDAVADGSLWAEAGGA